MEALCPEFLPAIPDDPYGLGAMKMKYAADGIAMYSIGLDGDDDGGVPHRVDAAGRIYVNEGDDVFSLSGKELGLDAK